jgi:hypothetical protein
MQSPSRLHDSDVEGSTKSQNVSPADEASASGTPTKKAVTFQDPAIKKAVTKRGTRNQSFRNSRVSVAALGFVSHCACNFDRAVEFLISFATKKFGDNLNCIRLFNSPPQELGKSSNRCHKLLKMTRISVKVVFCTLDYFDSNFDDAHALQSGEDCR